MKPFEQKKETPMKKRDVKSEEKQLSSARRISDKTFKQKMAELQAEAQGEKEEQTKKDLFPPVGSKRPATAALPSSVASKKVKKWN